MAAIDTAAKIPNGLKAGLSGARSRMINCGALSAISIVMQYWQVRSFPAEVSALRDPVIYSQ